MGTLEYKWRGPSLIGSLGWSCPYRRFLSCLGCSGQPSTKNFFLVHYHFLCPHRPATWAGNRARPPISECVSPSKIIRQQESLVLYKSFNLWPSHGGGSATQLRTEVHKVHIFVSFKPIWLKPQTSMVLLLHTPLQFMRYCYCHIACNFWRPCCRWIPCSCGGFLQIIIFWIIVIFISILDRRVIGDRFIGPKNYGSLLCIPFPIHSDTLKQ